MGTVTNADAGEDSPLDSLSLEVIEQVDEVCLRFERALRAGAQPRIEEFLTQAPEAIRPALLRELLLLGFEYRGRGGADVPLAEYEARFPDDRDIVAAAGRDFHRRPAGALPTDAAAETVLGPGDSRWPGGATASRPPRELVGYFGDYQLLAKIAHGGMGVVYKARQVNLDRVVALKMILAGHLASEADVRRFYQEAEAAANLDHPGIVPIHEVGQHEGQHFFSMAYVDGPSLAQVVADGPLPPREAAAIVRHVAEAIHYAHRKEVVHRDLKPANILLARADRTGASDAGGANSGASRVVAIAGTVEHPERTGLYVPKVADFGLAKRAGGAELTGTGQILGTAGYMPPEQAAGHVQEIGPAADVYSLGAVLYCALTGRPPFQSAGVAETLIQVIEQDPIPPRRLNPQVPRDLETVCLKCLEKDRRKRYGSAQALADELARYLRGEPILARPVSRVERAWRWCRRNPAVAGLTTAVALALLAGTIVSTVFWLQAEDQADENATLAIEMEDLAEEKSNLADEMTDLAEEKTELAEESDRLRVQAEEDRDAARRSLHLADIRLARQAIRNGEIGEVEKVLSKHIPAVDAPDDRGWEWYFLLAQSRAQVRKIYGHFDGTEVVKFSVTFSPVIKYSPDGKVLASMDSQALRLWDVASDDLLQVLPVKNGWDFAWSPDGSRIVIAARTGRAEIWQTAPPRNSRRANLTRT